MYANQSAIDHVGTTRDKVIGKNIHDGVGHIPDFMRLWMSRVDQAFQTGEPMHVEDAASIDGRLVYSESNASPIRNGDGNIFAVGVVYRNVTERKLAELENARLYDLAQQEIAERKQAEEETHSHEQRLQHMTEQLPIAVWSLDSDLRIMYQYGSVTSVGRKVVDNSQVIGTSVYEFVRDTVSEEMAQQRMAVFQRALRGETVRHAYQLGDRHIEDIMSPLRDDRGEIVGIVGVASDVTERVRAEEALRSSEQLLRHITAQLPVTLWSADNDLRMTYLSSALTPETDRLMCEGELVGRRANELDREILGEKDVQRRERFYRQVLAGETIRYETKIGDQHIEDILAPLRNNDGEITGMVGIAVDITERKRLEEELLRVEKLDSLSLLAGGIAHDFNNYLTAILSHLSLAESHLPADNKALDLLAEAERASQRATALTQQLMTFAKRGVPLRKTASIGELLRDSTLFTLAGSNIGCDISAADDLWLVECDEGLIGQAISNIVLNALQAMPAGGIIRVSAENTHLTEEDALPLSTGDYVRISIEDQGTGIPEDHLPKIFDPFFTTKEGGSGLGLPSAHSIIRKHDGHIAVESERGAGSTFHIYLPASEVQILPEPDREPQRIPGSGRILVMDDDEALRLAMGMMLVSLGYEAEFAANGEAAITTYKAAIESGRPFDVVMLDLTIAGGMGGQLAAEEIRDLDPDARIIACSGYSDDLVMANYSDYGFSGVIIKPFEIKKLSQVLNETIGT